MLNRNQFNPYLRFSDETITNNQEHYILCCNCNYAVKEKKSFIKIYQNTAICLCRKCAQDLSNEIKEWSVVK